MTECEWQQCTDPTLMLVFMRRKASDRKLRLFALACIQRVSRLFTDEGSRKAVEVLGRLADNGAPQEERRQADEGCSERLL